MSCGLIIFRLRRYFELGGFLACSILLCASARQAAAQKEAILYNFTGNISGSTDGGAPLGGLAMDSFGNLYGTTSTGGAFGIGTVFKVTPDGNETVLYSFGSQAIDGFYPNGGLAIDPRGNLYGTNPNGGTHGFGSVFQVTPGGSEIVLYNFGDQAVDGAYPSEGLIFDSQGNLYGTTRQGGASQCGTVFKIATGGTETVLYSFSGIDGDQPGGDDLHEKGGLTMDAQGNLYGATYVGGAFSMGAVFKLTPDGAETVLHSFGSDGVDGVNPLGGLALDAQGNLYGTTVAGGAFGVGGTVFKLTPDGAETVLYSFDFEGGSPLYGPQPGLLLDPEGNLYGVTGGELGTTSSGSVFELTPSGVLTVLHDFPGSGLASDGSGPQGGLIFDTKGNLYGVTNSGGTDGSGTVFEIAPATPAATPMFAPPSGTYTSAQSVVLSDTTSGATIYYTTDGSTPTAASTSYTGPITVGNSETIEAIAVAVGFENSAVSIANYTILLPAATPTFFPMPGTFTSVQSVTIGDATVGAVIYYTTDGSIPTTASARYTGLLNVESTETIKAIAVAPGFSDSAIASGTYTINLSLPVAAMPIFTPPAGAYTAAQTVAISDSTAGATIYYTIDGTVPTPSSMKYAGPIAIASTETIEAIAVAPGFSNSIVAMGIYTINQLPPIAATPVFTPPAGTYTSVQSVAIGDSTAGATIYYTTDGSTPTTTSSKYTDIITISSSTETLKAIAVASGFAESEVASATYTINLPAADFGISISPSALTVTSGRSGPATVTITPQNGFAAPVSFSCSGLPVGQNCTFSPATVTPTGHTATTTLTVSSSTTIIVIEQNSHPLIPGATLALALCCIGWRRRRRVRMLTLLIVSAASMSVFAGCGGGPSPQPTTSTVTVTGTSGSLQHRVTFTLTVIPSLIPL